MGTAKGFSRACCYLWLALAVVTTACAQEEQQYSCENVDQVPVQERCLFVTTQCDNGSRIPFLQWYYCNVVPAGAFARFFYMLLLVLLVPLLFTLLADTAELYFSPTMALVSQSIPKMRPRFAGVTFVAMGNGAPDLSANISAIRNGSVQLSAGAFTGAAMFVQCVVASEVIRISQGAPCRGATLRDVATYGVSLVGVALAFSSGRITRWFVAGALTVYALYAIWVFCGDEWHARGRPRPSFTWAQLQELLRQRSQAEEATEPQWASIDTTVPLIAADQQQQQQQRQKQRPHHHLLDASTYQQAVWADMSADPTFITDIRMGRHGRAGARELEMGLSDGLPQGTPTAFADGYVPPAPPFLGDSGQALSDLGVEKGGTHLVDRGPATEATGPWATAGAPASPSPPGGMRHANGMQEEAPGAVHRAGSEYVAASEEHPSSTWQQCCNELTLGVAAEWPELRGIRRRWRSVTFPLLLPMYAALRFTIPMVDPSSYSQPWLVVTMLCAPLAAAAYFNVVHMWAVVVAIVLGLLLGVSTHVLTRDEEELPALDLGTSFAFGPAVFSLVGFFMGVLWIDTLASEVVGILSLVANLASLPSSLVGLTLLAWGGSLGDFFGNSALAKRGHASTALTACFAGPLFIMLVSLALGFSSHFAQQGTSSMQVQLTPDVLLGCVFLIIYNVVVAVVGFSNGFRLPKKFFLFARAWYCLYLALACGLGLTGLAA